MEPTATLTADNQTFILKQTLVNGASCKFKLGVDATQ